MIRLIAIAFALTIATSAQATTSLAPLQKPDGLITQVRHNCGTMHSVAARLHLPVGMSVAESSPEHTRK
jgi:hypothetical protein